MPTLRSTLLADAFARPLSGGTFLLAAEPLASLLLAGSVPGGSAADELLGLGGVLVLAVGGWCALIACGRPICPRWCGRCSPWR